jgi:hypothetical protein
MREQEIKKLFPELTSSNFRITSDPTEEYNCIAWAADDTDAWWWPDPQYVAYWPSNVARVETIDAFVEVFKLFGYTICANDMHEKDFEKITIYVNSEGKPTHAARQLDSGNWTSKLGNLEDIEHTSLDDIICSEYGSSAVFMKRPK